MTFRDVDPNTGKETYREAFSIAKFAELCTKLDNVWHVTSHLIFITCVIYLVLLPDVPDAGRQLPFAKAP